MDAAGAAPTSDRRYHDVVSRAILSSLEGEYRRYKRLGEGAFGQLAPDEVSTRAPANGHSVAILVWHVAGNLKSRFTDFLTSDGEKPWRRRESEFAERKVSPAELLARWEEGWSTLFAALAPLGDADLARTVRIRGEALSVVEALHRSLAHASYHVGQIVSVARSLRGEAWTYLSIPPGKSEDYNRQPTLEKPPRRSP
jgi:hypothetical protein